MRRSASGVSEDDELWLLLLGCVAALVVLMNIDPIWSSMSAWLVDHYVLTTSGILLPLPGGVGLDAARLALLAAALLLLALAIRTVLRSLAAAKLRRVIASAENRGPR